MSAERYSISLSGDGSAQLSNPSGGKLFSMPLQAMIEIPGGGTIHTPSMPYSLYRNGSSVTVTGKPGVCGIRNSSFSFTFYETYFTCRLKFSVSDAGKLKGGNRIEYFRGAEIGMRLNTMWQGFCVPKSPKSEEDYLDIFPFATMEGLASPPPMVVGMKFAEGFVSIGLLDFSDATGFGVTHPFMGLAVDALGGDRKFSSGDVYEGPSVAFMFPEDGIGQFREFREILKLENRLPASAAGLEKPDWWKRPAYCTYGDQIMDLQPVLYSDIYWDSPFYTGEWVRKAVINAEKKLGWKGFTVIVDAFWQKRWDTDPAGDPERFPDMRGLVEWLHSRGHKVLLWYSPHIIGDNPELAKIARKYGVTGRYEEKVFPKGSRLIDYTADNAGEYVREICRKFFSDADDCLNADGIKMDFLFAIPPTEKGARYLNPGRGMGMRMIKNYLEMLYSSVGEIKPDALINYSSSDPRLAHLFSMNRLHDTKITPLERERRARLSSLSCPELVIDSDGAIMTCGWVAQTYTAAAIYGTPSLYYVKCFNDGKALPDGDMRTLGRLFKICASRQWGVPEFLGYGRWRLRNKKGDIVGESYPESICWLMTGDREAGVISFADVVKTLNTYGRKILKILPRPEGFRIRKDTVTAKWKAGVEYLVRFE